MALVVTYIDNDGSTDISDRVYRWDDSRQVSVLINAEEGSVGMSRLLIDDPEGDFVPHGHHRIVMQEDEAATDEKVIGVWNIGPMKASRGGKYYTGPSRVWELELADINNHIGRRIMVGSDCKRPAETDVARIQWLLSTAELGLVTDELYVDTTGGVAMDAADYTGQNVDSILHDCAEASGRNYFIWFNEAEAANSLWYKHAYAATFDSPLRISNVLADVDESTTFYGHPADELNRDPGRLVSGVYLPYGEGGKYVYVQDLDTADVINMRRDMSAPSYNVKTAAKATARANRYLAENDEPDDELTVTVILPRVQVNQILAGMRIEVKYSHLDGYEDFRWCRILSRQVTHVPDGYILQLTLSPAEGPPTVGIDQFVTGSSLGSSLNVTWPDGPVKVGALLIGFMATRANVDADLSDTIPISHVGPGPSDGDVAGTDWTWEATAYGRTGNEYGMVMASRIATSSDTLYPRWRFLGGSARPRAHHVAISGLAGTTDTPVVLSNQHQSGATFTSPSVTVAGAGYIWYGFSYSAAGPSDGSSAPFVMNATPPAVELTSGYATPSFAPFSWFGYLRVEAAGTYSISLVRSATPRGATNGFGWLAMFTPD